MDYAKTSPLKLEKSLSEATLKTSYKVYVRQYWPSKWKIQASANWKEEAFDDSKVLGTSDRMGTLRLSKPKTVQVA